jgi:hypothetical protein
MAEESPETRPKRRYTRRTTTTATTTRRRRASGSELVDNLNSMVNELIKENRKLRRQIDKLSAGASGTAAGVVEKGLRSIQRRLQRAVTAGGSTTRRRRSSTAGATTTRRRTTRRRTQESAAGSSQG